eukprot:gene3-biopygen39
MAHSDLRSCAVLLNKFSSARRQLIRIVFLRSAQLGKYPSLPEAFSAACAKSHGHYSRLVSMLAPSDPPDMRRNSGVVRERLCGSARLCYLLTDRAGRSTPRPSPLFRSLYPSESVINGHKLWAVYGAVISEAFEFVPRIVTPGCKSIKQIQSDPEGNLIGAHLSQNNKASTPIFDNNDKLLNFDANQTSYRTHRPIVLCFTISNGPLKAEHFNLPGPLVAFRIPYAYNTSVTPQQKRAVTNTPNAGGNDFQKAPRKKNRIASEKSISPYESMLQRDAPCGSAQLQGSAPLQHSKCSVAIVAKIALAEE